MLVYEQFLLARPPRLARFCLTLENMFLSMQGVKNVLLKLFPSKATWESGVCDRAIQGLCVVHSESTRSDWFKAPNGTRLTVLAPSQFLAESDLRFDPLDGSSNVDAGIAVGTIFGIFKARKTWWDMQRKAWVEKGLWPAWIDSCARNLKTLQFVTCQRTWRRIKPFLLNIYKHSERPWNHNNALHARSHYVAFHSRHNGMPLDKVHAILMLCELYTRTIFLLTRHTLWGEMRAICSDQNGKVLLQPG